MAKNTKIPTLQEIEEYRNSSGGDRIYDLDHVAMSREMTIRILSVDMSDDTKATAWKFCKALAKYSHAPVSAADYKRMEKWVAETALIDVLLEACGNYFPNPAEPLRFDITSYPDLTQFKTALESV